MAWDAPWIPEPVEKSMGRKETVPSLTPGVPGKAVPRPAHFLPFVLPGAVKAKLGCW